MQKPGVLIPAYKPDNKLITLIKELRQLDFADIVVVDDGSGPDFEVVFTKCADFGCTILRHGINMGKGRALKTGLNHYLVREGHSNGMITADADGQHTPDDIQKIAEAMDTYPDTLVLGVRLFKGIVPLRNKLGNTITRHVFSFINGETVYDTQTGLRGLPDTQIPLFLSLDGERYEYEMNMLLSIRPQNLCIYQVPIETIYIEGNKSSHYRAVRDSARIYKLIFTFTLTSLISGLLEYGVFIPMTLIFPDRLMLSVVAARLISSVANYLLNGRVVFGQNNGHRSAVLRYYALAAANLAASYLLISLLTQTIGINLYAAKVISDISLYLINYRIQRDYVYRRKKRVKQKF